MLLSRIAAATAEGSQLPVSVSVRQAASSSSTSGVVCSLPMAAAPAFVYVDSQNFQRMWRSFAQEGCVSAPFKSHKHVPSCITVGMPRKLTCCCLVHQAFIHVVTQAPPHKRCHAGSRPPCGDSLALIRTSSTCHPLCGSRMSQLVVLDSSRGHNCWQFQSIE